MCTKFDMFSVVKSVDDGQLKFVFENKNERQICDVFSTIHLDLFDYLSGVLSKVFCHNAKDQYPDGFHDKLRLVIGERDGVGVVMSVEIVGTPVDVPITVLYNVVLRRSIIRHMDLRIVLHEEDTDIGEPTNLIGEFIKPDLEREDILALISAICPVKSPNVACTLSGTYCTTLDGTSNDTTDR